MLNNIWSMVRHFFDDPVNYHIVRRTAKRKWPKLQSTLIFQRSFKRRRFECFLHIILSLLHWIGKQFFLILLIYWHHYLKCFHSGVYLPIPQFIIIICHDFCQSRILVNGWSYHAVGTNIESWGSRFDSNHDEMNILKNPVQLQAKLLNSEQF